MGFKQNKSFLVLFILSILSQSLFVKCQDEDSDVTTQAPDEDTTTENGLDTTTPTPPQVLEHLDYKFSSLVGGFTVDVNFTQLSDNPSATFMSMFISSTPDSGFDKQVCTGKIKLIAINQPNCDGVVAGSTVDGEEIATIDKASGSKMGQVEFSISFFRSRNCLIVASTDPSTATTSTEASSTSVATSTSESPTTPDVEASTAEGGEDDTTESATGSSDTDDDAEVQPAESRIKRQLTSQLGNANLGDGAIKVEKHQYDVKKIANQVDTGDEESVTDKFVDQPEEAANLDEYYDPEDIDQVPANNVVEVSDVGEETADVDDDQADAERLGLEVEELSAFRSTGCKNAKIANKIELFTTRPSRQARALIPIGAVFSVGSVPGSITVVSSGATTIVNFGSTGSFTFNPLANWPLVVLQGSAVLGTYGVIIIWALILGAIVWSVSVGQFSGLFSAKRVGYVASNLVYGPIERLTTMVHNGIERFSDLNRRNSFSNNFGHPNNRRKPNPYQHRSSYAYDEDVPAAVEDNSDHDYKFETDYQ